MVEKMSEIEKSEEEKVDLKKRHESNPFIENMVLNFTSKQVKVSSIGKDDNIIVNQSTGEINGTHVVTYKKVDNEEFVKLFTRNIALTFDLNSAGIKAFNVLIWTMQHQALNRDLVALDSFCLEDFLKENSVKLSITTFKRGLNELEKAKIIAKGRKMGEYFINPNFMFNGNRIAFTTAIELKKEEVKDDSTLEQRVASGNLTSIDRKVLNGEYDDNTTTPIDEVLAK